MERVNAAAAGVLLGAFAFPACAMELAVHTSYHSLPILAASSVASGVATGLFCAATFPEKDESKFSKFKIGFIGGSCISPLVDVLALLGSMAVAITIEPSAFVANETVSPSLISEPAPMIAGVLGLLPAARAKTLACGAKEAFGKAKDVLVQRAAHPAFPKFVAKALNLAPAR